MLNSIRDSLTKEDVLAEIRLQLDADISGKTCIIVVEGADDITFFRGKLCEDADVKESFSGKMGVYEIVDFFLDDRVIGICDRDYDPLYENSRVFYYDYSCLEMMLISSDSVFCNFCYTYYCGQEAPIELRMKVFQDLKWISFFRKLNSENSWGVRFTALNYHTAFDDKQNKLDLTVLLRQLTESNPGLICPQHEMLSKVSKECRLTPSISTFFTITNGHDFMYYFQHLCCIYNRQSQSSRDEMFKGLVCSFYKMDFEKTSLFSILSEYQCSHNLKVLS